MFVEIKKINTRQEEGKAFINTDNIVGMTQQPKHTTRLYNENQGKKCTTSNRNHPSSKLASSLLPWKGLDFRGRAAGKDLQTHMHACLLKGILQQLKIEPEIFQARKTWAPISLIPKPWTADMLVLGVHFHPKEPLAHLRCWLKIQMEKAMAPHSSTLAWKIPWTEEPGGL